MTSGNNSISEKSRRTEEIAEKASSSSADPTYSTKIVNSASNLSKNKSRNADRAIRWRAEYRIATSASPLAKYRRSDTYSAVDKTSMNDNNCKIRWSYASSRVRTENVESRNTNWLRKNIGRNTRNEWNTIRAGKSATNSIANRAAYVNAETASASRERRRTKSRNAREGSAS